MSQSLIMQYIESEQSSCHIPYFSIFEFSVKRDFVEFYLKPFVTLRIY